MPTTYREGKVIHHDGPLPPDEPVESPAAPAESPEPEPVSEPEPAAAEPEMTAPKKRKAKKR